MSNPKSGEQPNTPLEFSEFPEDVQLSILSFLTPSDISSFASTSKRFTSLCHTDSKLWFSLCDRRWGHKTHIARWGSGNIAYRFLYKTLLEYEKLIGFWRLSSCNGNQHQPRLANAVSPPGLFFFEWGRSCIIGSRVRAGGEGGYGVIKEPFLFMGIGSKGEVVNFLEMGRNRKVHIDLSEGSGFDEMVKGCGDEVVMVDVNCMGEMHIVIEERVGFGNGSGNVGGEEMVVFESESPPNRVMSEMYQYFANRTSPAGRRRRREKERNGNRKWDAEHFVKIADYCPTSLRPLQGLWKGICEDANLDFYLVTYDDLGGIACRKIGDSCKPFSSSAPVFWTSKTTFFDSPFSSEEEYIYDTREHLMPPGHLEMEAVSRILFINSSYDLVLPGLVGPTTVNPHPDEGRIWQYGDGTFGFGFLRDNHIIDLKHIAVDGCLLDATQPL